MHSARRLFRYKVRRRFFYRQLALERRRQALAVPLEAFRVKFIKKVYFVTCRAHVGMYPDEFEQGARAALFNADYEGVWEFAGRPQALLAQETVFG